MFLNLKPKAATLSDADPNLMNFYRCVQDDPKRLVKDIDTIIYMKNSHDMKWFYNFTRDYKPECKFKKAAFCYYSLCFSFNRIGKTVILDRRYYRMNEKHGLIFKYHNLFKNAYISACSYSTIAPESNDFVYFDPPYYNTDNAYDFGSSWGAKQQIDLRDFCNLLSGQGVKIMVSNSNEEFVRNLYSGWNIIDITKMKSVGKCIKYAKELLIRNY